MRIRVLVLSPDPLARGGIAGLIAAEPGLVVVGEQAVAAPELCAEPPELAVWDLGAATRPDPGPLFEAGLAVLALAPDTARAVDAMEAGAGGVIFRDGDGARLAAAALAVCLGLSVIDAPFREALLRAELEPAPGRGELRGEELTPRELQVLALLANGLSNRAIGRKLGISENTARFHVNAILGKLGARSRTDAVVRAARAGLVML